MPSTASLQERSSRADDHLNLLKVSTFHTISGISTWGCHCPPSLKPRNDLTNEDEAAFIRLVPIGVLVKLGLGTASALAWI